MNTTHTPAADCSPSRAAAVIAESSREADLRTKPVTICFTLSMPNVGSWNGKWSGADRFYAVTRKFTGKRRIAKAQRILAARSYYYGFEDGWGASVSVRQIDGREAATIRRKSNGFCGYDWMIDSIVNYGRILADHEIKKFIDAVNRTISISEHVTDGPFVCTHCRARVKEPGGYVVSLLIGGETLPVDGVFCSENCATREARETRVVDRRIP